MIAKVSWMYSPTKDTFTVVKIDGQGIEGEDLEKDLFYLESPCPEKNFFQKRNTGKLFGLLL